MKPNELMIGDWVVYDGDVEYINPIRIEGIDTTGLCITSDRDDVGFDGVQPIPLTAEILEKNGFIGGEYKSYTGYVWYLEEKGFIKIWFIMSCEKSILWGEKIKPNGSFSIPNIKFVHELQHALRLCNIDKEIEL